MRTAARSVSTSRHRRAGVHFDALRAQPAAEVREDALGEQHAAGRREQGEVGAREAQERAGARASTAGDQNSCGSAIASRHRSRGAYPAVVLARDDQGAGRVEMAVAEVGPEPLPGGVRGVHHAGVAGHGAIGEAGQPMLVAGRGERIGDRALLVQHRLMPGTAQRPGGAQAHDAAADDDHPHALTSRVCRNPEPLSADRSAGRPTTSA